MPSLVTMMLRAGLGDQEIGAGDADIGGEEAAAQHGARLAQQRRRLGERALGIEIGVGRAEGLGDLLLVQMDRRRDDDGSAARGAAG